MRLSMAPAADDGDDGESVYFPQYQFGGARVQGMQEMPPTNRIPSPKPTPAYLTLGQSPMRGSQRHRASTDPLEEDHQGHTTGGPRSAEKEWIAAPE